MTPGVYIKEVPSGARLISGASTSVAAFMGFAPTGPTTPTRVRNWREFTELYHSAVPIPKAFTHANRPASVVGAVKFDDGLYLVGGGPQAKLYKCDLVAGTLDTGQDITSKYGNDLNGNFKGNLDASAFHAGWSNPLFHRSVFALPGGWASNALPISDNFYALPESFKQGDWDAVAAFGNILYVFKGDSYLELDQRRSRWSVPRKIAAGFPLLPPQFRSDLDGAVVEEGVLYLFKRQETAGVLPWPEVLTGVVFGYFANGGGPCYITRIPVSKPDGNPLEKAEALKCFAGTSPLYPLSGLAGLERAAEVTMVAAPDMWNIPQVTPDDVKSVQQAMAAHCAGMGNRMAILDPPQGAKPEDAVKYPGSLSLPEAHKPFATVYYPWVRAAGAQGGEVVVPPSGHVAGVWCRTDEQRGVHKAPANEALTAVTGLERVLSDGQQGDLNPEGVNCLRTFPGRGHLVWGARTLSKETDWQYLNVRRLVNYLSASIKDGTSWAVFEPNDERLRAFIRMNVTAFLTAQWRSSALKGQTAEEAFYVVCDESNNPPASIAQGTVVCDIGIAPVRPAEFVLFQLTQMTATAP
ncbi:phage tail sheath C-terminal domain-containing protein [Streptomyces netropsis]